MYDISLAFSALCAGVAGVCFLIAAWRWHRAKTLVERESPPLSTELPSWLDGTRPPGQPQSLYALEPEVSLEELEPLPELSDSRRPYDPYEV